MSRELRTASRRGAGPSGARTQVAGAQSTPGRRNPPTPQRRGLARLASKHPPNGDPRRVRGGAAVLPGPPTPSLRRTQVRLPAAAESRTRPRLSRPLPARGPPQLLPQKLARSGGGGCGGLACACAPRCASAVRLRRALRSRAPGNRAAAQCTSRLGLAFAVGVFEWRFEGTGGALEDFILGSASLATPRFGGE